MPVEHLLHDGISLLPADEVKFDNVTFEVFFKENFQALCVYCQYKFAFDLEVAKEVVHTGFIRLWENRYGISQGLPVKAYLYKIITNVCIDMLRHNQVKRKHEKHLYVITAYSANEIYYNNAELNELKNSIDQAVASLPDQMRKIFILSRYEGLKYSEVSDALGISVKTVETQMSRALVKLRHKLSCYLTCCSISLLVNFFA